MKNITKIIIIAAVMSAILFEVSSILTLKGEDGINQMQALYKQPEESIDVIFLGSSLVYCDISTGVLWDKYGIAGYDLGGANAPAWVSYYMLKEALRNQKPKLICYEVSVSALYPELYQSDEWAVENNYGMKCGFNRIKQLYYNSNGWDEFFDRLVSFNVMHGRYNDIEENDFVNVRNDENYKGFDPINSKAAIENVEYKSSDVIPCSSKAEEYTRKIIDIARKEGIQLVMFVSPRHRFESEYKICNYMRQIAKSEGVDYIDFNDVCDDMELDFENDMADGAHLNLSGTSKFSEYFGRLLREVYIIPDRRGNKRYSSWDVDANIQRNRINNILINECDNIMDMEGLIGNGYIVFYINNGAAYCVDNGETVSMVPINKDNTIPFKIIHRCGSTQFLFIGENDEGELSCSLYINDDEYKEELNNVVFVFDSAGNQYVRSMAF